MTWYHTPLGVPIRIHPLTLPFFALALWLESGSHILLMALSLLLHELAHIGAARAARVRVLELELLPFGGAARIAELWLLRPGQIILVALAGPACNLILIFAASAAQDWGLLSFDLAAALVRGNLAMMLFNLLPALPLDGGRILCGALSRTMRPARAALIGVMAGRVLGCLLLALGLRTALTGQVNVLALACGLFLLASGGRELQKAGAAALDSLIGRRAELLGEGAMPIRWLAVSGSIAVREVAARMHPRYLHRLLVLDDDLSPLFVLDEKAFLAALLLDAEQAVRSLAGKGEACGGALPREG